MASRMIATLAAALVAASVGAQQPTRDEARYVEKVKDPVIAEMEAANEAAAEAARAKTAEILAGEDAAEKARTEPERELRFDVSGVARPAGPEAFTTRLWHLPPVPQYLTGTCWSFSTVSFLESEVNRLSGREVKLSEMWVAYWEYVAKARGFVASRGRTAFEQGSQSAAAMRVLSEHGIVPLAAYPGVLAEDARHDHDLMHERMKAFLHWCREQGFWDEEVIVACIRTLLDATMGRPPEVVAWEEELVTPLELRDRLGLVPDDYVDLMSTLQVPFFTRGEYAVPDNWWHDRGYVNLPLEEWYAVILSSLDRGISLVIGGDVSEPGMWGEEDIAIVPTFDIPAAYIDQSSREYRFAVGVTEDDHGIHLVGHTRLDGHDWFLIKDSGRSSRRGRHEGYYFYRDDFVRLKMLTITVHRSVVEEILARVDG